MIDEAGKVAKLGGVYDGVVVHPEHVGAANAGVLVVLLPQVSDGLPDGLTHILNHHLVGGYGLQGKQTPVVDARLGKPQLFLTELRREKKRFG